MIQKHGHAFHETDRCCYNCKHILWLIGVGQGLRCGHNIQDGVKPPTIPSISYVCDNFKGKGTTEWSCKCDKCSPKTDDSSFDWTLGSGDVTLPKSQLDKKAIKKLKEENDKAVKLSIESAEKAVKQYAKTVENIMENPDDWSSYTKGEISD